MTFELVIHGGTVIDPAAGLHARRDLGIRDGRVAAVEPSLPRAGAADEIDASGLLVMPGLVDLHVHVYWGVTDLGIPAGPNDLARGTTTIVDAGSAGANTLPGFRRFIAEPFAGRLLAFLSISAAGMIDTHLGEFHDLRWLLADRAAQAALDNPDLVVGFKVRLTEWLTGPNGLAALERALEAGVATGLPVMVHIGDSAVTTEDYMSRLRGGDIVTHAFTDRRNGLLDDAGRVHAAALEARARGARFDIGHGAGSFSFRIAEAALADGFRPDTISTDLHRYNVDGPVFDMVTTMSKFLHLGLPLPDVVAMATSAPAAAIGRVGELGSVSVGAVADVAVLRLEEGPVTFTDSFGVSVEGRQRLVPVATLRAGRRAAVAARPGE